MRYAWKKGSRIKGDADEVGRELQRIEGGAGHLTPLTVLSHATQGASLLHPYFEWDDSKAGPLYREEQARHLLRSIVIRIEREPEQEPLVVRAFHPVTTSSDSDDEEERSYVNTVRIWSEPDLRAQVLSRAVAEIQALEKRYAEYAELTPLWTALREIESTLVASKEPVAVS